MENKTRTVPLPVERTMQIGTAALLAVAFLLTLTVSDYYIFNRIGTFGFFFVLSQWIKKAGLLLLPLAVFYRKKCCADIAKYLLPLFVVLSCFVPRGFFDITMMTESATPAERVYAHINEFMPRTLHIVLFYLSNALYLLSCALLFVRDGVRIRAKSFLYLPFAFVAVMPLNLFENFFDITAIPPNSFLRFRNFTVWHFLLFAVLVGFTIGCYYFLRRKDKKTQYDYLAAGAIVLLLQYHSKDSVLLGDGYNVYHTIFAALPLFICNIGVYIASIAVLTRKRVLYAISFFVHAAGALTVFFYFGRDDMSDYGIFCSYSILYFALTHCLLFALSVLPSALGHYKFRIRDCVVPLVYYCGVIVVATVASGLVSSASMSFSYDGYTLQEGEWLTPNYAFTQINPLPIPVIEIPFTIWRCSFNLFYLVCLYLVYVALFWTFTGGYYFFLYARRRILARTTPLPVPTASGDEEYALREAAATSDQRQEEEHR